MANQIKWWLAIIIASVFIIYWTPYNIIVGVEENLNRVEAESIAEKFLNNEGYETEGYFFTTTRTSENNLLSYLKSKFSEEEYNDIISSDNIPNMRWVIIVWKNVPKDHPQTQYYISVSPKGNVIGYQRILPDTLTIESLSEDDASRLAQLYLTDRIDATLNNYILKRSQQYKRANRTDYTFIWEKPAGFVEGDFALA